jgi:hypothetical protein
MIVETIYGPTDDSLLTQKIETIEDDDKIQTATEYYLKDELVHRSVNLHLKKGIEFGLVAASII